MTVKSWGIFALENEVEDYIQNVKEEGLEIFEVRKLTFLEKLTYVGSPSVDMWIIMFKATEEEYNNLIKKYDMTSMF